MSDASETAGQRLVGRAALVTGGGTGLGRAIAIALAHEGAHVAVNYSRSRQEAETTAEHIRARGGRALAVHADVSRRADVEQMVRRVEDALGPITILVNNAGVTRYIPFDQVEAITDGDWDQILGVNLLGSFLCAQVVVPHMRARGQGKILNVASNSAFSAAGSSIPYVVSKAAVASLTQCLARALAPSIQVNAVAPGWMATRWLERFLPTDVQQRIVAQVDAMTVAVDEVAAAAIHLLTNDAVTGQVLVVDHGELLLRP